MQWLYLLARLRLGACLADDMGLGKTIQVLSLTAGTQRGIQADAQAEPGGGTGIPACQLGRGNRASGSGPSLGKCRRSN